MKLLKILTAPIALAVGILVRLCSGILYIAAPLFGLAGFVFGLLGVALLLTGAVRNGITLLVIAWLVSPVGIPLAAAWLLGKAHDRC